MDFKQFKTHINECDDDDYISTQALEFFFEQCDKNNNYKIITKSALEKDERKEKEFVSVATVGSVEDMSDRKLIKKVKDSALNGDVQKYQFGKYGIPNKVEIWIHGSGYSAFAVSE